MDQKIFMASKSIYVKSVLMKIAGYLSHNADKLYIAIEMAKRI